MGIIAKLGNSAHRQLASRIPSAPEIVDVKRQSLRLLFVPGRSSRLNNRLPLTIWSGYSAMERDHALPTDLAGTVIEETL